MILSALPFPDISPELISFSIGGFELALRWYSLAYIVGILFGWWICVLTIRRAHLWANDTPPMTREQLDDFITWLIVGIIVGGRLGAVFLFDPSHYLANPIEIFQVWKGGMSFHGGFIGVALVLLWFQRKHSLRFWPIADMLAVGTPLGLMLGRLANFINAELWGRETDVPWGVIFPGRAAQTCVDAAAGLCARHPSQLYEAASEGLILGIVLLVMTFSYNSLKRSGLNTGVFLAGYGLARFVIEFWREPDPVFISENTTIVYFVEFGGGYGIAMGQLLSLPMLILGLILIFRARHART